MIRIDRHGAFDIVRRNERRLFGSGMEPLMIARRDAIAGLGLTALAGLPRPARSQAAPLRIGVLGDQTSVGSAASGLGSVMTAKMAAADFGGSVLGRPIEIISADFQTKPDIAIGIARRWFDQEGVSAITDMPISSAALAVQGLAREKKRTMLISTSVSSDLTAKACSPYCSQWADDSYSLSTSIVRGLTATPGVKSTWFLIVPDYALGLAMQRDATDAIRAAGGTVVGTVRHPIETLDFSSVLLQAQASGAAFIGLGSVGDNMINTVKQAHEFGLTAGAQTLAVFLAYITDIQSIGLETAQGLNVVEGFYWDQSNSARAFGRRYLAQAKTMPSKAHAATYASVMHYLRAVQACGTDAAEVVNPKMRATEVDFFGRKGRIREDGRVVFDLTLYRVKGPSEVRYPWDYYEHRDEIGIAAAYRPVGTGGCTLPT